MHTDPDGVGGGGAGGGGGGGGRGGNALKEGWGRILPLDFLLAGLDGAAEPEVRLEAMLLVF